MEISPIAPSSAIPLTCPKCGAAIPLDAARCQTCGTRVARLRPSAASTAGMNSVAMLGFVVLAILWVFPSLLCRVEMCALGQWLEPGARRMLLWIPMTVLAIVNGVLTIRVTVQNSRDGWATYARQVGGTLRETPGSCFGALMQ